MTNELRTNESPVKRLWRRFFERRGVPSIADMDDGWQLLRQLADSPAACAALAKALEVQSDENDVADFLSHAAKEASNNLRGDRHMRLANIAYKGRV